VHGAYFEIVGVIADYKNSGLQNSVMPEAILPYTISGLDDGDILARTTVPPSSLLSGVRSEIWAVDSNVAVADSGSLISLLQETSFAQPQFDLVATGAFAALGLALVVIGIFSLMAYSVSLQTHEIGIRLALGATQKNILKTSK
jgi:ABC-type antimicrobial peptide transport system permease subunit